MIRLLSLEVYNFIFEITDENISFAITIPRLWETKSAENIIDELNELLALLSLELDVKEVRKRANKIKIGDNDY